jgi:hypothetical protein
MYVLQDATSPRIPYYIHHKHFGTNHHEYIDVLSDYSVDWMYYYTINRCKDTHCYVCVDVITLLWWMNVLLHTSQV